MKRARTIGAGLALLCLLGLGAWFALAGPDEPLDAQLVGFRLRTADGEPTFDRDALPAIRLSGDAPVEIEWHPESGATLVARVDVERQGDGQIVQVTGWSSAPEPGMGTLRACAGRRVSRWPARWAVAPDDQPALASVVKHRQAGELVAAREALDRAANVGGPARLWVGIERARLAQMQETLTLPLLLGSTPRIRRETWVCRLKKDDACGQQGLLPSRHAGLRR